MEDSHLLLLFGFLCTSNPGLGISLTEWHPVLADRTIDYTRISICIPVLIVPVYLLWIIIKSRTKGIENPQQQIYFGYVVCLASFSLIGIAINFSGRSDLTFYLLVLVNSMSGVVPLCSMIVCAYQVMKYCEEGYESFCINALVGCLNVAVNFSNYFAGVYIQGFITKNHYSTNSIMLCVLLSVEISVIPLLLSIYFLGIRNSRRLKPPTNTFQLDLASGNTGIV